MTNFSSRLDCQIQKFATRQEEMDGQARGAVLWQQAGSRGDRSVDLFSRIADVVIGDVA